MRGNYRKIKMGAANVITSVSRLHDHLLSLEHGARKGKLVASTTLRAAPADSRKAIGEIIIDLPWCLIAAHVGGSARVARCSLGVFQQFVGGVTGLDRRCDTGHGPPAGRFAAVPGNVRRHL